jgi:hypothetical protein
MEEILASIRRIIADNARPDDLPAEDLPPDDLLPEDKPEPKRESRPATEAHPPADTPPASSPPLSSPPQPVALAPVPPAPGEAPPPFPPPAGEPDALVLTHMLAADGSVVALPLAGKTVSEVPARAEEALLLTRPLPPEEPLLLTEPAAPLPGAPLLAAPIPAPAPSPAQPASWSRILAAADQASAAGPRPSPARPRWIAPLPATAPPPAAPGLAPEAGRPAEGSARTIEDLVREALEPKLQAWLDLHLQDIVERRVQEEIDRISRLSQKPDPEGTPKP